MSSGSIRKDSCDRKVDKILTRIFLTQLSIFKPPYITSCSFGSFISHTEAMDQSPKITIMQLIVTVRVVGEKKTNSFHRMRLAKQFLNSNLGNGLLQNVFR